MSRGGRQTGIRCPVSLFARQETEVNRVTRAVNQAPRAAEKAIWAQVLMEVVDVLLGSEHYDEASRHCRLCQEFSQLRRKTAALIVKAEQLDDRRRRL